jgi:hypothetical protein
MVQAATVLRNMEVTALGHWLATCAEGPLWVRQ